MSSVYNMGAKLLSSKQLGYYCGAFVYKFDGKWCICKDYAKRIDSLALPVNKEFVVENYISMLDWIKTINPIHVEFLTPLIKQRFKIDTEGFYDYLRYLTDCRENYLDFQRVTKEEKNQLTKRHKLIKNRQGKLEVPMRRRIIESGNTQTFGTVITSANVKSFQQYYSSKPNGVVSQKKHRIVESTIAWCTSLLH